MAMQPMTELASLHPTHAEAGADKLPVINGLRGLAILAVIYHHFFIPTSWFANPIGTMPHPWNALWENGFTGVNLFFLLSGFVLYLPYANGSRRLLTWRDARGFYLRRLSRLMPLYYLAAVVLIILAATTTSPAALLKQALQLLSFSYMFGRYSIGPALNGPLWSFGVEVLFSLVFPALIVAILRFGIWRVFAAALMIGLATRTVGYLWFPRLSGPHPLAENLPGRIDEFVYGMAIAKLYADRLFPPWASRLFWPGVGLIALSWIGFSQSVHGNWPVVTHGVMNNLLDLGLAMVTLAALAGHRGGEFLSFRPLQLIGMMCFSLYVWHFPLMGILAPAQGLWVACALTATLSVLTYRYVEFGRARAWRDVMPGRMGPAAGARPAPALTAP